MQPAHDQFQINVGRARDPLALYTTLSATTTGVLDLMDILRAALVIAVSAFDHLVHEIARIGMLETYDNKRPMTDAFRRFSVTMENVLAGAATPGSLQWLDDEIRRQHSWISFQQADKVAQAIRLVSSKKLWEEIGTILGIDARSAKDRLNLIVDRRNRIAHEADMDYSSPGARWPIDEASVQDAIDVLVQIADAIYQVVTTP
jgi:RiboL-PSP-HEPN